MRRRIIGIILKIARSRVYLRFASLMAFFDSGARTKDLAEKITANFLKLKNRISKIIDNMRKRGVPSERRMYFYRLVRKFLPAFPKFYKLGI